MFSDFIFRKYRIVIYNTVSCENSNKSRHKTVKDILPVPADFFAQFEKKMNAVIDADIQVKSATETVATESGKVVSMRNRWAGIAAAAVVLFAISMAFQFDWLGDKLTSDQDAIAANPEMEDEYDPAEDVFYASLSDYEVYDLICGI